ncbi:hypothetical protein JKF63_05607 [Porcisia hertigi]|uniref:Uncharacterized protein n=1 Tax=Porcisia hertigi TaxID=2761500 RepID=A0A836LHS0_9TRYP|nr:hypothetical protein JKF63_05607 [Porcisia hertigi]
MGFISSYVGVVVFTVIQFCVVVLVIIATPLSQLESMISRQCYTFWGYKMICSSLSHNLQGKIAFGNCTQRYNNMNGGAAFAIISIFTTIMALVFGILMLLRISCTVILPLVFTCLSVITLMITWACVVGAFTLEMCDIRWSSLALKYGPGFGIMVTACCVQFINVVLLLLLSFC